MSMKTITVIQKVMLMLCALLVVSACSYDDEEIWNKVNDHEARISALEDWQKQVNSNITALQELLNTQDYITKVTPVVENDVEIGYTIEFAKSDPITLYHGKKGESGDAGSTPVISLTKEKDGNWYWTLNGELMKDEKGNPIRANGLDGKDGEDGKDGADGEDGQDGQNGRPGSTGPAGRPAPTPQVSLGSKLPTDANIANENVIETSAVYLSVDGGSTWYRISGEKGDKGDTGSSGSTGDSMIESIEDVKGNYVEIILHDGSSFKVAYYRAFKIGTDESNDAIAVKSSPTTLDLKFPDGLTESDVTGIIAEVIQVNNGTSDIATRADDCPVSVEVINAESGITNAQLQVTYTDAIVTGDTYMIRATLIYKDGSTLVTARALTFTTPPKIGDILYSDGSYSTDLISDKTPVGIIFYLGTERIGEAEKAALAAKGVNTPTGLAMALSDATVPGNINYNTNDNTSNFGKESKSDYALLWCVGSDPKVNEGKLNLVTPGEFKGETELADCFVEDFSVCMNDISGLANSQLIWSGKGAYGDVVNYPAFNAAKRYAEKNNSEIEDKTTGWFFPSVGQWIEILKNLGNVSFENNFTYNKYIEYFKMNTSPEESIYKSINQYLEKIPSAKELYIDQEKCKYHTSSEGDNYRGSQIKIDDSYRNGLSISFGDKDSYDLNGDEAYRVRCILAF